jgi:hypothetical protein
VLIIVIHVPHHHNNEIKNKNHDAPGARMYKVFIVVIHVLVQDKIIIIIIIIHLAQGFTRSSSSSSKFSTSPASRFIPDLYHF